MQALGHLQRSLDAAGREFASNVERAIVPLQQGFSRWWEQTPVAQAIRHSQELALAPRQQQQGRWVPVLAVREACRPPISYLNCSALAQCVGGIGML